MDSSSMAKPEGIEGMLQRLFNVFRGSFDRLGVPVGLDVLEDQAVLIHKAMTVQTRNYHNLEHVFNLIDEEDPIRSLAALYHDIVYYQVDLGFLPQIHLIISSYIREQSGSFLLVSSPDPEDELYSLTLAVFGRQPGQSLSPENGLNEFLSALVMNKKLGWILPEKDLLKITLCIEATIPFRGPSANGEDYSYTLERRASSIAEKRVLPFSQEQIEQSVKLAVKFANRDVENFAEPDASCFLDTTWKLLPELNVPLRSSEVYTIREYRQALQGMENFLTNLRPEVVFHHYRGVPPDEAYEQMVQRAARNIETAREYLRVKLVAQAILEALAELTGGDAPLTLFMGDLPHEGARPARLEDYLPDTRIPGWVEVEAPVYKLLAAGRRGELGFDLKTAPTSLFLYTRLRPEAITRLLDLARQMFAGELSSGEFLAQVEPAVRAAIARACAEMVFTRRELLLKFAE
jgi:hypothetical protein